VPGHDLGEAVGAQGPARLAWRHCIEADQTERILVVDDALQVARCGQIAFLCEGTAQSSAVVVVAGDGEDAGVEQGQDRRQVRILLRPANIGKVARQQDEVGRRY
jgi:hypothetical protein